jgi:hypothetical protein
MAKFSLDTKKFTRVARSMMTMTSGNARIPINV